MDAQPSTGTHKEKLQRNSGFSYACNRCSQCCRNYSIRVNPYEVARLAKNQGISTTEFLKKCTKEEGTVLNRTDDGACIFLNSQGCSVHPDRPLVCRLYPLGRFTDGRGGELFERVRSLSGSLGVYGEKPTGTVMEYLESQGAFPFTEVVDRYNRFLAGVLQVMVMRRDGTTDAESESAEFTELTGRILDMDAVVNKYCEHNQLPVPDDVEEKLELHLKALEEWIESVS